MKTGIALGFVCLGGILAFAVTGTTSVFNFNTAGWVIMIIGLIGLFIPRRTASWLGRRMVVRRTRGYPGGPPREEVIAVPPYLAHNPGTSRIEAGLPARPTLLTERDGADTDPVENAESHSRQYQTAGPTTPTVPGAPASPQTEVVEDLYENPD